MDDPIGEIDRRCRTDLQFYETLAAQIREHYGNDPIPNDIDLDLLKIIGGRMEILRAKIAATPYYQNLE